MDTIIPLFMAREQPSSELAAQLRMTRLDRATSEEMRAGLELLRVIDPIGFDVALPPKRPELAAGDAELGEPVAICGRCGSLVALSPGDLAWRHYRGALDLTGARVAFDAGHEPEVEWHLLEEVPEELLG